MARMDLQHDLEAFLGSRNVYFQPPPNVKLKFPAIVYELSDIDISSADDMNYISRRQYQITIIDANPDTEYVDKFVNTFIGARFSNSFVSDNLNHYVFTIYR